MPDMAQTFDVCIRGAGIVGRTLALLLARERLRVALVAPPQPRSLQQKDVRAYALNASSRAVLQSLRCWPDDEDATPVVGMQVFGDLDGQIQFDAASQEVPALAWIVDVPALEQRLIGLAEGARARVATIAAVGALLHRRSRARSRPGGRAENRSC